MAVQQFLAVVRAGRSGGWRAWEPLAAQIGMEDRTALMEFVAVLSMVLSGECADGRPNP